MLQSRSRRAVSDTSRHPSSDLQRLLREHLAQPPRAQKNFDSKYGSQHHQFAHQRLRQEVATWSPSSFPETLESDPSECVRQVWRELGEAPADGLRARLVQRDDVVLLTVVPPPSSIPPQTRYIAAVLKGPRPRLVRRTPRYFTLDVGPADGFELREWGPDVCHRRLQVCDQREFIDWVFCEVAEPYQVPTDINPAQLRVRDVNVRALEIASAVTPPRMSLLKVTATYAEILRRKPDLTSRLAHVCGLLWWQLTLKREIRQVFSALCLALLADELVRKDPRLSDSAVASTKLVVQRRFPHGKQLFAQAVAQLEPMACLSTTRLTHQLLSLGWEPNAPPPEEAHSLFVSEREFIANFCRHLVVTNGRDESSLISSEPPWSLISS